MTFFRIGFGYGIPNTACLEPEFDEPDDAADAELCRAIVAGKAGLHPDGWGNHDPLPLRWLLRKRPEPPATKVAADVSVWKPHRPKWDPLQQINWAPPPPPELPRPRYAGEVQLTCDQCDRARFGETMSYREGWRDQAVRAIRLRAAKYGWTCIVNYDRCPQCSQIAPPDGVGNGAGGGQTDEQHADGGQ